MRWRKNMNEGKIPKELKLENTLGMDEGDFNKLGNSEYDLEEEKEKNSEQLLIAYNNIIDLLKKYCDLNEDYYPIIAIWIIGTYSHENFRSYPYLFLNAMRGSGKSRTLKLITDLSKDGELQMSMTEAVLFRTKGTLGIDEFESVGRKGNENLRELLNSAYKRGTKVKRMKQKKGFEGMEQVVESFDVYRPIVMANIWGMEEVLGDRCISLVLEKSNNPQITKLQEIWDDEKIFQETKKILNSVYVCRWEKKPTREKSPNLGFSGAESRCVYVCRLYGNVYKDWNNYITSNYTSTYTTSYTQTTHIYTELFKRLNLMDLDGRSVELCFPLFLISFEISENVFEHLHKVLKIYMAEKKEDQFSESKDISFIDYVSQEVNEGWILVKDITQNFKDFIQYDSNQSDDWLNPQWVGQAIKRLKLKKESKRTGGGIRIILDIKKAQERIKMFK